MITPEQRDWIMGELDKITYDPRSHKNERLFRRSDIQKILTANTDDYTSLLEQKLRDIECGDCGKNMLECECDG